jgi:hypothetical protein
MCITVTKANTKSSERAMVFSDSDDTWSETDGVVPKRNFPSTRSLGNQNYRGQGDATTLTGQAFKRTFVEHSYHDHCHDHLENIPRESLSEMQVKRQRGPRGGVTVAFPEKLHEMLSRMDEEDTSNVVSWQPHGRCFLIHKKKDFVSQVMSRYVMVTIFKRNMKREPQVKLQTRMSHSPCQPFPYLPDSFNRAS